MRRYKKLRLIRSPLKGLPPEQLSVQDYCIKFGCIIRFMYRQLPIGLLEQDLLSLLESWLSISQDTYFEPRLNMHPYKASP